MKKYLFAAILLFLGSCTYATAQTVQVEQTFVDDSNRAFVEIVALRAEKVTNLSAIEKLKAEINSLHVDIAVAITEKTDAKNELIQARADFQFLLTNGRKKCFFCVQVGK